MWTASARSQYRRSGGRYESDVTDAEFALIEPLLPRAKPGGRPRTTMLREVLNAMLYLLRTGCPWAMLPKEFPPKSTVYGYFRRFGQEGVWQQIWMVLTMAVRGARAARAAARARLRLEIARRPAATRGFEVLPRRWVIERSFAWLGRNRRLAKDFARLIEVSTTMAIPAIIQLLVRRLAKA